MEKEMKAEFIVCPTCYVQEMQVNETLYQLTAFHLFQNPLL